MATLVYSSKEHKLERILSVESTCTAPEDKLLRKIAPPYKGKIVQSNRMYVYIPSLEYKEAYRKYKRN